MKNIEITPYKIGDELFVPTLNRNNDFDFIICTIKKVERKLTQDKSKYTYFYKVTTGNGINYLPIEHHYLFLKITELVDYVFDDKNKVDEMKNIIKNILVKQQQTLF